MSGTTTRTALVEALDEAVQALATHDDTGLVIGWALVMASTRDQHTTRYSVQSRDGQPAHHTVGLLVMGPDIELDDEGDE